MNKKRILLCAYNYPPLITPQSLRWFYLTRELNMQGYKIDVLTIRMPEKFQELVDTIPEDIEIYRTFPGPLHSLTYHYSRKSPQGGPKEGRRNGFILWNILTQIQSGVHKILNFILVPDNYAEWLPFALWKGRKLLKENQYDIIISSSEPRVCHLLGYFLKKESQIPWIADYGDTWIYPISPLLPESRFKQDILRKVETRILQKVDALTVAARGIKRVYLEQYPFLDSEKIHVITQGYDPDAFSRIEEEPSQKFRIVYCGSFYRNLRNPMNFLHAIKEIDREDIEVIIAGRINEFVHELKKDQYKKIIIYRGFLNHFQSLALEKSATLLLHIGTASDIQVPGKLYEYFGARRPILCVQGGEMDLSVKLVSQYNKGLVVQDRKKDIKEGIIKLYSLWKNKQLDRGFNLDEVKDCTWKRGADQIARIIEGE
jgi:glycosyltransferase involved in cell wall biosynthesis